MKGVFAAMLVALCLADSLTAQDKPDFSGTWAIDRSRSDDPQYLHAEKFIIAQTLSRFNVTAIYTDTLGKLWELPWDWQFDRWRPRRGGAGSQEPLIQARWDGQKVVGIKAPFTSYTMAFIFSLSDDRQELLVESVNPGGIQSTFKESSVSPLYVRRRFVFIREHER
ncbi:MAG: hypothetical protein IT178_05010 [Acidobacteria bacterium]|nr:hypothetical protein [Acidobacteriota bacterium]